MSNSMIWLIVGLAVVTYIPRMIPLVFFNSDKIPPVIQNVLKNVPFAILGALIFPGILTINDDMMFGVIGAVAAIVAAYLGANLIVVVMFAVAVLSTYAYFI
ncbi:MULTISPECIES: AzlD domain-containing protein [Bacillales]|uniref:AzlD domain-containing protein n=1 Tax=Bacillales TaxID=1385 RepID=UPI0018831F08|nr:MULTISPECIES: AzlD domain-containing protein [Bacillaceae]MBF0707122.1 AzlD domain-containing protein [Pseudalkalibacillus hwajinpoensis]MDO6656656.1 AzlD domain-containing protein [Anaerobacillus sp. 1_MG-2023]WLR58524.1 AzlD domain-containing protein [Pseudalkalibacillus hwajinpoensis]